MPSLDPTKTAALRLRYASAMNRRFLQLATDVRKSLVDNDALGLRTNDTAGKGQFNFPTSAGKVRAFQTWLERQIEKGILEVIIRSTDGIEIRRHWQNAYLRAAYVRAVDVVEKELKRASALNTIADLSGIITTGIHAETLELMYTRAFEGLRGITRSMSSTLSTIFSQALTEGVGPKVIAKRITDEIKSISKNRAIVLARTETIRVFAEASLNVMEQNGVEGIKADVEFLTAQDRRTCKKCLSLEGHIYTTQQARGVIPVHARCRCRWAPVIEDTYQDKLEREARKRSARERIRELQGNQRNVA